MGRAGKERDGSDDRVDGGESLRWIDWGILYWGELRWEGARWKRRHSARTGNSKNSSGRGPLGGSDILRSRAVGTGFQDKFHQCDFSEKLCAQDFSSGMQRLCDGTCVASLAGSDAKNAQLLARFSGQISSIRLFRKSVCPRPAKVSKPWAMGHA